jgi:DNA-binding NarL/FixJ family response regulator
MLRILIAEDHAAVRRAIRSLLESQPEWRIVGEATNGREAVEQAGRLKPDVVLLDVVMPQLNGVEAMREILKEGSVPQILFLTAHQSEELLREVIHAGAEGIVSKSAANELLIPAIESLIRRKDGIHLAGSILREKHVAVFSHSKAEGCAVLDPFIVEGLRQGHKVFCFLDHDDRDDLVLRLRGHGLDIQLAEARHQLQLITWKEVYLSDGSIEYQSVLDLWAERLPHAAAEGFSRARIIGYMDWTLKTRAGPLFVPDFEAQFDRCFQNFDDVLACAACAYDLSKFESSVIEGVARSHDGLVVEGSLEKNRSYVSPARPIEQPRPKLPS